MSLVDAYHVSVAFSPEDVSDSALDNEPLCVHVMHQHSYKRQVELYIQESFERYQ